MNTALYSALICLSLGLLLRVIVQRFESRHLGWIYHWLRQPTRLLSDTRRETLLDRSHKALSFARLGRLVSLALVFPAIVSLMAPLCGELHELLGPNGQLAAEIAFAVLLPFVILALVQVALMRGFYRQTNGETPRSPAWLTDEDERIPGVIDAGWSLWDGIVRGGEHLSERFGLARPQAYLVEQEGQLMMAVGDRELGGLDKPDESRKGKRPFGERDEADMVRAIQRLDETLVREVMRPLNNVTALPLSNLTSEKFLTAARRTGFTRFPCYFDTVTNLIGYLNVHDFLDSPVLPTDPRKLVHQALFLPELARVDLALREMQRTRQQIAICFDEYGGCSGLLSREDIIEEITGEIMDEYDRPELKVQEQHGNFLVDGTLDLDDLEEMLGLDLREETFDTLAGYLFHRLSRMPRRGEIIEEHGWRLEIVQLENHRVRRVRLTPPADWPRPAHLSTDAQPPRVVPPSE